MPEIAECYSIASKIPELGEIIDLDTTPKFSVDIDKHKTIGKSLINAVVHKPFAYGKSIWFPVEKKGKVGYLVSQLGMTGSWNINNSITQRNDKHNHLNLEGKTLKLSYNDPRRFGKMNLYWGENWEELKSKIIKKNKWGLDPFSSEAKELINKLQEGWSRRDQEIKKLLLEQNLVFGIGNYLASEILFKSKINPAKKPKDLSKKNYKNLVYAIKFIITRALKSGGFSFAGGYILPDGSLGNYADKVLIYGKEFCKTCKGPVSKDYIGGRITYWCSKCQKK